MIMGHANYERSDFRPNSTNKMAAGRPSWIRSVPSFAHGYIQSLSTSFLFIMYINYEHGSHKIWKFWFWVKFSQKMAASQPSWIWSISNFAHRYIQWLSTTFLFITYINYGHELHKLWMFWFSWNRSISNVAHSYIKWLSTSFQFIMYINYGHRSRYWMI